MTAPLIHMDPNIFPEPNEFLPERWLENPRLDRYLFSFSKGARICLGCEMMSPAPVFQKSTLIISCVRINLAYQELYLVTAAVFRKYDLYDGTGTQHGPTLALYETTRERDVDMAHDFVVPFPTRGSKGVRVLIRS